MEENKVLYCQSCGAPLKIVMNKPFVFCQFCGAKNIIDSQQMKAKIKFQNIDISANTETDSIIDSAEFAIQTKDFAKAKELIMAAIISGRNDYKIYVCKAHMDLLTDDNRGLFDDLEKLRKIEQKEKDQEVTDAICELMQYKGINGVIALHNATFHERMDMVEFCVEHGADVNARAGMNNVSPISIMYVPISSATQNLNGTPFIRNKKTVKMIHDYLIAHGAYDDYKPQKRKITIKKAVKIAVISIVLLVVLAIMLGRILPVFFGNEIVSWATKKFMCQIEVNAKEEILPFIVGYDDHGYFDNDIIKTGSGSATLNNIEKPYTSTIKLKEFGDKKVTFELNYDFGDGEIVTALISSNCNSSLSNGDTLDFSVSNITSGNNLIIIDKKFNVTDLPQTEFETFDPRDYFGATFIEYRRPQALMDPYGYYKIAVTADTCVVGDKTIHISIVDDKKTNRNVQPGIQFEIFDKDNNLIASGKYLLVSNYDLKYESENDCYYVSNFYGSVYSRAFFDQNQMLYETGILFSNKDQLVWD